MATTTPIAVAARTRPSVSAGITPMNSGKEPSPIQLTNMNAVSVTAEPPIHIRAAGAIVIRLANSTSAGLRPTFSDKSPASTAPTAGQSPVTAIIRPHVNWSNPNAPPR